MQQYGNPEKLGFISTDHFTGRKIEVGKTPVKCVASNIRRPDVAWDNMQIVNGLGHEGNLVVVEALSSSGFRTMVENQLGVEEQIYKGDRFVGVLANRHSGTSESGDVPLEGIDIHDGVVLNLLSAGGVIGIKSGVPGVRSAEPLPLKTIGLVADKTGNPIDLVELSGGHHETLNPSAPIILVCGTSAEVGKTTTSRGLIRELTEIGAQVAGTKLSGTGRLRDIFSLRDAGAMPWLDFPDVGLATTYTSPNRYTRGVYTLLNHINSGDPDFIVAEAGGDPIEANVPTFLSNPTLMQNVKAFVIVAGDVMGMMGTVSYLQQFASETPIFLTDPKDRNAYATRERVSQVLPGLPMFNSLDSEQVHEVIRQIIKL